MMNELKIEDITAAIKQTEYKYFGDYEFSESQQEAVDVLVRASVELMGVKASQSEWVSVATPPELQFESEEDPDSDGYPQFDGMVSQTVEVTDGDSRSFGHFRSDGLWIVYIKGHDFDMLNVDPPKVSHYKILAPLPTPPNGSES